MRRVWWKVLLLIAIVWFQACEKPGKYDEFVYGRDTIPYEVEIPPGFRSLEEFRNYAYKEYARTISLALKELTFREWLKQQFLIQFDGDYDLLHVAWCKKMVSADRTYAKYLADISGHPLAFFEETLPKCAPRLNVCFPEIFDPELWNVAGVIPKTTFLPEGFEDSKEYTLELISDGEIVGVCNSRVEPNEAVLVVGESERVSAFKKPYGGGGAKILFEDEYYVYTDGLDVTDNNGEVLKVDKTLINPNELQRRACQRDHSGKADKVYAIKFNSNDVLRSIESWARGKVEMYFKVVFNSQLENPKLNELTKNLPTFKRKKAKGGQWIEGLNLDIMRWEDMAGTYGSKMKYIWYERDGGGIRTIPVTLELKIKSVNATLKTELYVGKDDDFAGESFVEYCDPVAWTGSMVGTDYNTGYISYNVRL